MPARVSLDVPDETLAMPKSRILTKSWSAAALDEKDVVGLEIAVNDPALVRGGESIGDLSRDVGEPSHGHRPRLFEHLAERLAVEPLHDEVGGAVGQLTEVRDVDDVRIADRRCGLRFLQEAVGDLLVARHVGAQDLDGHLLVDDLVAREVDDAHPAFAEHRLDAVAAVDGGSDVGVDRRRGGGIDFLCAGTPAWL